MDVIYTDIPESVISCDDIGNLANSDHSIIRLVIDFCPNYNSTSEMIRDWKRGDVEGLAAHLSAVNFSQILQDKNANEAWEALKDTLDDAMNRYIPFTKRRAKGDPPWMTRPLKQLIRKKQRKWKFYVRNRDPVVLIEYKALEKKCKKSVQSEKRNLREKKTS